MQVFLFSGGIFYAIGLAFSHSEMDHNIYKSDPEVYFILFYFTLF